MHPYSYRSMVPVSTTAIVVVAAVHLGLKAVFFSAWFLYHVAYPIEHVTLGIVSPSTLVGLLQLAIVVGIGVGALANLRPADFLLVKRRMHRFAMPIVFLIAIPVAATLLFARPTTLLDMRLALGGVLTATVGSAVPEEIFYRGFLLIQMALLLRARNGSWSDDRCILIAIIVVQSYFGLNHIPAAIRADAALATTLLYVVQTCLVGTVLSILYLQSGHLGIAIAAHASINLVIPGGMVPEPVHLVALVAMCSLAMAGPVIFRRDMLGGLVEVDGEGRPGSMLRTDEGSLAQSPRYFS